MKKSLIALAIASAVSAPAFAATSNVDVYGKLSVSVNWYDDQCSSVFDCTGAGSTTAGGINDLSVSSNSSRIGFKGAEDLGGGLSAIWQIESSLNMDEGNGNWAGRNSFLGLKGGWGTALMGNHDTPLKLVGRAVDLFSDGVADSRNVMGGGSDTRAKNTIAYISPNMSGFGIAAAYSTDFTAKGATPVVWEDIPSVGLDTTAIAAANVSDAEDYDVWNINATYSNGPLYLGGAWGGGNGHDALGVGDHWRLAAGYTFGNFKVVGQYDNLEDNSTTVGTQQGDFDSWMIGGAYTMGAMVFKANYMEGEYDGETGLDNGYETEQWTLGMDYNLSKRTTLFALYVDGQNIVLGGGAGLADQVIGTGINGEGDLDVSALSFGVSHSF